MANDLELTNVLNTDFEYTKCTKPQLRDIMSRLGVENIPSLYVKKDELLSFYEEHVHKQIAKHRKHLNFSSENTFQSPIKKKETARKPSVTINVGKSEKTKDKPAEKPRDTKKYSTSTGTQKSSTEKPLHGSIGEKLSKNKRTRTYNFIRRVVKIFLLNLLVFGIVWFKFFMPYCEKDLRWCVPLPRHSHLVDGVLFCNKGYRKVTSIIDYCVYDTRTEYNNRMKAKQIIKTLENIRGEYRYGLRNSPQVDMRECVADEAVWEILRKSDLLSFNNSKVESLNYRITIRLWLKYHILKGLKGVLAIIGLFLFIRIMYSGRRRAASNREKAEKILPIVCESLNKQVMIAIKTQTISDTVYSTQLQEAFNVEDEVWVYVEELLKKNSNVESFVDESGELKFKWVGLLFYRSSKSNEELLNK